MSTGVRTIYIELRASAERLQQDLVDVTGKLDRAGKSGKEAGGQISTGMTTASESFGRVAKTAVEAGVAIESVAKAAARYSSIAAVSGTTTEGLVNSYRALRIALDPSMFTVATIAAGVLTEQTIKLTLARARLIEQQSLIAAKSGVGVGQIDALSQITSIAGGNTSAVLGLGKSPQELTEIAIKFAAIQDPAQRAALAVQLFGDKAGVALQELNSKFVSASSAVQQYGIVLTDVSRNQIYTFRKDLVDLKDALLDFSSAKAGWESVKTRAEEIAAAFEDMVKRGTSALGQLIDKQTGLGGLGKPGTLSAGDIAKANAGKDSVGMGMVADDLFAQAQGAHFRQSQTLEGQQAAQRAAQERADSAYGKLNDGTQRTSAERFGLATEQQSAQALATAIGVRIKGMKDAADAEAKAEAAAEELAKFQAGAGERLNALYQSATLSGMKDPVARSMYEGRIEIGRDADKTTDSEKSGRAAIATQNFRQALADLQKQLASGTLSELAKEEAFKLKTFGEQLLKKTTADDEANTKQRRVSEIQIQGATQPDEAKNSADKLAAERAYGTQISHTFQQQLAYMQQIAKLDDKAAAIAVTRAQDELDIANANGDVVRAADAQLKLEKAITDQLDQQYKSATQILIAKQKDTLGNQLGQIGQQGANSLGGAAAKAIIDGKGIGTDIRNSLKGIGKEMLGTVFSKAIEEMVVAITGNTIATNINTLWTQLQTLVSKIPFLAGGGDVSAGHPVVVGDGGRSEVFVPDTAGHVFPSTSEYLKANRISGGQPRPSSGSNYGGHTFNVTQHIYETQDAQESGRQFTSFLKAMIPSAAVYGS